MSAPPGHVLMTADTVGGVWSYAMEMSRALTARGTRVSLATMGAPLRPAQKRQARAIRGLRVYSSNYKLEWMQDPWDDVAAAGRWLLELESRLRPDVVHLNGYVHGALPWNTPVVVVAHSCVYSWWNAVHGEDPPPEWRTYRRAVWAGLREAGTVVAVSGMMAEAIQAHYGIDDALVIYNARNRRDFSTCVKTPLVFSNGRIWDEAKNLLTLDEAAAAIRWPVYVAGDASHPDGRRVEPQRLNTLGQIDSHAMRLWLSGAAIYVSPARYEPFGLSVLEAALSGCALVLSDISTFRELWEGAALFVEPDDAGALADAVNRLAADDGLCSVCARCARARARRFNPEQMIRSYLEVYAKARSAQQLDTQTGASCA